MRGRIRIAFRTLAKNLDCRFQCPVKKKLAAPIEDIAFAGIHVRGSLEFIGRRHEVAFLFFHLPQKIVQFRGIFSFGKILDQLPSVTEASRERGRRAPNRIRCHKRMDDALGALKKRHCLGDLVGAGVELA